MATESPMTRLDPKVFEYPTTIKGKEKDLFGDIGRITRVGKYYSLNLGFDTGESSLYRLLVLDTEEKEFSFRTFFNFYGGETWKSLYRSIDPRREGEDMEDFILNKVTLFLSKMEKVLSGRTDDESIKTKFAITKGLEPLALYYSKKAENAQAKLQTLRGAYDSLIDGGK